MWLHAALLAAAVSTAAASAPDKADVAAVEAACYDNIDGQLEGNVPRVERTLHPDVAIRSVSAKKGHAQLALDVETRDELLEYTRKGALVLPRSKWNRSCRVIEVDGTIAAVRAETPNFVSFDHYAKFDGKWLMVNSLWRSKP